MPLGRKGLAGTVNLWARPANWQRAKRKKGNPLGLPFADWRRIF